MKKTILGTFLCVLLIICLSISIKQCSSIKREYIDNINILNDTIEYYKAKNGDLVATKLAYESDLKTLKILNEDLYKQIENLKIKNKVKDIVYINTDIVHELHDTTYTIQHDTIYKGFYHVFDFTDRYRELTGNIEYSKDSLQMRINKDIVHADYTVAIDKNNKVYITSDNPYIRYNEIQGYTVPKPKKKRWSVGPSVSVGYNIKDNNISPVVGLSLQYGILQW